MMMVFADKNRRFLSGPNLIAFSYAIVALIGSLIVWKMVVDWHEAQLLAEQRASVIAESTPYGNALTGAVNGRFALLSGLHAFTESHADRPAEFFQTDFDTFASGLYANASGIRNFAVGPNGVNQYVFPLEENETVLGHDLINDERPNVRADVQRAINTDAIAVSGPYELRQGGQAVIARQAVFENGEFWGLVAMVLDMPPIISEAGLDAGNNNLHFALKDGTGTVFFGDAALFEDDPVIFVVDLPEGSWELAAVPIAGWDVLKTNSYLIFQWGSLFVTFLVAALAYLIVNRQARLNTAVQQKTGELSQTLQKLQDSEALYRSIVEDMPGLICSFQPGGMISFVNDAYCQFFDKKREDLVGQSFFLLIPEEDRAQVMQNIASITVDKPLLTHEHRTITASDQDCWQRWTNRGFFDENGQLVFYQSFGEDITNQKVAESDLKKRAHQQAIVAQLGQLALTDPPLLALFDEVAALVADTLDAEFCKVLELLPEEEALLLRAGVGWQDGLIGEAVVDAGTDSQAGYTLRANEPVIVTDLATDKRFNGPPLLCEHGVVSGMSTVIAGGKRPFGVIGVHAKQQHVFSQDDVNFLQAVANVLAEAVVRKATEAAFQESETRYRLLVEMSPDGIVLHRDNKILFVNETMVRLAGAEHPDELIGRSIESFVHPDHWPKTLERAKRMMAGEQGLYPAEDVYVRLDGTAVPVEVTVVSLTYQGEMTVQVIVRDISQRKKNNQALAQYHEQLESLVAERTHELEKRVSDVEQLNNGMLNLLMDLQLASDQVSRTAQQLEETNAELESFAYSVSHDLRAPLRHISGFVTMLQNRESERLDEKSTHYLQVINGAALRMGQLIDDLLAFSRTSRKDLHTRPLDVNTLVAEAQRELSADLENRNIIWHIDTLPTVTADPSLLRQVWINLIGNAVKYTTPRTEAHIEIGALPPNEINEITFFVRDNGVGFNEKYIDKLFGVFQRLHRDDEFEGTGIGLATVRRIIHRHNGRTWAEGEIDKGATFYFTIPAETD